MYVCNHVRLDLGEVGYGSDVPLEVLQADAAAVSFTGYVAPDYEAPAAAAVTTSGGTGGQPQTQPAAGGQANP